MPQTQFPQSATSCISVIHLTMDEPGSMPCMQAYTSLGLTGFRPSAALPPVPRLWPGPFLTFPWLRPWQFETVGWGLLAVFLITALGFWGDFHV